MWLVTCSEKLSCHTVWLVCQSVLLVMSDNKCDETGDRGDYIYCDAMVIAVMVEG